MIHSPRQLGFTLTDWERILNTKRKVSLIMRKRNGNVDFMTEVAEAAPAAAYDKFGIPSDPAEGKARAAELITKDPDAITSGKLVGDFKITVKTKDKDTGEEKILFESETQPFGYMKFDSLAGVLENEGAELSDDQVKFLGEALSGEKNGEAVKSLIDSYNGLVRTNAKNNEYGRVFSRYAPMTEETKTKKVQSIVRNFAQVAGITEETAREMLKATKPELFA